MTQHGMEWHSMARNGMEWHGMAWDGMAGHSRAHMAHMAQNGMHGTG